MWSEEAYDAFVASLEQKFPKMYGKVEGDDSYGYGGISTGPGWWPIISALSSNIQSHLDWKNKGGGSVAVVPQVRVRQIKEKFGGLRFYYDGGDDHIAGLVRMAESWASRSCEDCGAPGKGREGGWLRTLCDAHEVERQARMKERDKE